MFGEELRHYGVKGMKWGIRKKRSVPEKSDRVNKNKKADDGSGELRDYIKRYRTKNRKAPSMAELYRKQEELFRANPQYKKRVEENGRATEKGMKKIHKRIEKIMNERLPENKDAEKTCAKVMNDSDILARQMRDEQVRLAIQDANRALSLGISGGTNPFLFG